MTDPTPSDDYQEVTLADLVRTIYRRRVVLVAVFLAVLVVGVSFTAFTPRQYEAEATVIPLDNQDIIKNWLASRQGADYVVAALGDRVVQGLYPGAYDADAGTWKGAEPTAVEAATRLLGHVDVSVATELYSTFVEAERLVTVTVQMTDPALARDVANAYLDGLETLRPVFESIYQDQVFEQYYDGTNPEQARSRAETAAKEKDFWLVLDQAVIPQSPSSPNVMLNLALSVVLGGLLGVFAVFFAEWFSGFRAESRDVVPPERTERAVAPGDDGRSFGYRGK